MKEKIRITVIALFAIGLVAGIFVLAASQDNSQAKKTDVAVQKVEKHAVDGCTHSKCSVECKEKHAKGECTHPEGSAECKEKHAEGEYTHPGGSVECKEKHAEGVCIHESK
ncbi:hypothetical protein ES705_10866 [subsurface metagenome]